MLARVLNLLPFGKTEVQSPVLRSIYGYVKNVNSSMEYIFSKPFEILSNTTDILERFISANPVCCSYCLCLTTTVVVTATSVAVGVGVGVGVGCNQ